MKEKLPLKAPNNEWNLDSLQYPVLVSYKLDGIRCIYKRGEILSASMKTIPNTRLKALFEPYKNLTTKYVFDGELYSHEIPFSEHVSCLMSKEKPIHQSIKFYVFDIIPIEEWEAGEHLTPYTQRIEILKTVLKEQDAFMRPLKQCSVTTLAHLQSKIESAEEKGYEGIMIRNPSALYKNGRASTKQNIIHKYKFWIDYDGKITDVAEMKVNSPNLARELDNTGHMKPVHSKFSKMDGDTFGSFTVSVQINDNETAPLSIGSWKGLTDDLRKEIWNNRDQYIGRWVRFKSMAVGQKHLPRIIKDLEFRDSKDD